MSACQCGRLYVGQRGGFAIGRNGSNGSAPATPKPIEDSPRLVQQALLIVDDDPDFVSAIQCRLEWCHFVVITANTEEGALEKAAKEQPDVVLLDIDMQAMDGYDVLKRMRKNPALKDTPVIIVTARCEPKDISASLSFGIAEFVSKPFDHTELTEKVRAVLKGWKSE